MVRTLRMRGNFYGERYVHVDDLLSFLIAYKSNNAKSISERELLSDLIERINTLKEG
jgi:hypothetical protein